MIRHAGLLAVRGGRGWRGVLIEGPSGAGKSDLALRAIAEGFRLVADDRTLLWISGGRVFGRAPDPLRDLIEVRGQGVLTDTALPFVEIALVMRCGAPERLPPPQFEVLLGARVPLLVADPREASAVARLRRGLHVFDAGYKRRI